MKKMNDVGFNRAFLAKASVFSILSVLLGLTFAAPQAVNASQYKCNGHVATIVGTSGDDLIEGTDGRDVIVGLDGDDIIEGNGGNDIICGNRGNDTINGGAGVDKIYGNKGDDRLMVGYNPGPVTSGHLLHGGPGNDRLEGGADEETLRGGRGNDILIGWDSDDRYFGGGGHDTCSENGNLDSIIPPSFSGFDTAEDCEKVGRNIDVVN